MTQQSYAAIRDAAAHLLHVACSNRGYRAAAPGLLHGLSGTIRAHLAAARAVDLSGDCLLAEWSDYAARWTGERIATDWAGFEGATRALLSRILARTDLKLAGTQTAA